MNARIRIILLTGVALLVLALAAGAPFMTP